MWKAVDDLLARGIAEGIFPGCAMAAGQGTRVFVHQRARARWRRGMRAA